MRTIHAVKGTDLAILVLIVAACAIPFLGQPFHMDDNFYMDMARNAQAKPLFPNDTPYVFQGMRSPDMGSHTHPLFQTYFLATIMHFFGEGPGKEWIYHLFALLYPLIAALSFYFICARLLDRPLWPSALFACSPLFLVMQHTLMTDIPMLAFWLAAVCCFLYATDQRKAGLYAASVFFPDGGDVHELSVFCSAAPVRDGKKSGRFDGAINNSPCREERTGVDLGAARFQARNYAQAIRRWSSTFNGNCTRSGRKRVSASAKCLAS